MGDAAPAVSSVRVRSCKNSVEQNRSALLPRAAQKPTSPIDSSGPGRDVPGTLGVAIRSHVQRARAAAAESVIGILGITGGRGTIPVTLDGARGHADGSSLARTVAGSEQAIAHQPIEGA